MTSAAGPLVEEDPRQGSLARLEHEMTVLIRRTMESVWAAGYEDHPAIDRYTYPVLLLLDEYGDQSLTALTGRLGVSKPTASRQVSRLSRAGLVDVRPDERDSRSVVVSLTEEGHSRRAAIRDARLHPLHAVVERWPEEDRRALAGLLARFNEDLAEYGQTR